MLVVAGLFGEQAMGFVKTLNIDWGGTSNPEVVVVEPAAEYKEMVKPIVDIDFSKEHEKAISGYFNEVASVLENDPGFVKTTGQFRDFNIMAGQLNFTGTGLKDAYPNFGELVDEGIIEAIGIENKSLSKENRDSLVSVLRAIAWSVQQ